MMSTQHVIGNLDTCVGSSLSASGSLKTIFLSKMVLHYYKPYRQDLDNM